MYLYVLYMYVSSSMILDFGTIFFHDHGWYPFAQEHELFRVFDSLEYEDAVTDKVETGFTASGDLSESQTKDLMPPVCTNIFF